MSYYHRSIQRIIDGISSPHWMAFHYKNSFDYIIDLFPLAMTGKAKRDSIELKRQIVDIEEQIKTLNERLTVTKEALKTLCPHPVESLVHSGYAVSGSSEKYGRSMHEWVVCENCGHLHSFETPTSQAYDND